MRNFKKLLSLVLCMAVMLSVMVVGAGAAFSDQTKIKNTEAVDACVALNIINGYTDGSFKPEGTITRAEACKMICVALNGGKDPALGNIAKSSFTDTKGHWAEGYIESCVAQGIVAGIGGGKFNPNGNVTGSQFAKMLLIALGYNADNQGYTGDAWEVNVNVDASSKGLYEDLAGMDPSKALTRDNAAQMLWNDLNAYEVEYKYNLVSDNGQLTSQLVLQDKLVGKDNEKITLLEDKYEAKTNVGVLSDIDSDNLTITMDADDVEDSDTGKTDFKDVSADYSALLGQHVKVLFKSDSSATVLGVYATDDNEVVINTTASALDTVSGETKIKVDGTKYSVDDTLYIDRVKVVDGEPVLALDTTGYSGAATIAAQIDSINDNDMSVVVISNDGNSKIDRICIYEASFAKLTATNNSSVSYKLVAADMKGNTTGSAVKLDLLSDEPEIYSGYEKDDYVFVSADLYNDCVVIEKADTVIASCDGFKSDSIKLDGVWYDYIIDTGSFTAKTNKDYTAYVYGAYAYYLDGVSGVGGNVDVLLVKTVGDYKSLNSGVETKAYFDTTSTQVINVTAVITPKTGFDLDDYDYDDLDNAANGDRGAYTKNSGLSMSFDAGKMYAYLQDGSDYILIALNDKFTSGDIKTAMSAAYKDSSETVNGMEIEDDAQVYIRYKSGDYKIITGSMLTTYKNMTGAANSVTLYDDDDNVVAVYIDINGTSISTTDTLYGVVKGVSKQAASDGDGNVVYLDLITADGRKNVETEETSLSNFHKGMIVSFTGTYELANDDVEIISDVSKVNADFANGDMMGYIAISSYSDSSKLIRAYEGLKYGTLTSALNIEAGKIVSDSVVIYIDEDNYLNDDGTPSKADAIEDASGTVTGYYANAFVIVNDDNEIELLVYETDNNRIKDGSNREIAMSFAP